MRGIVFSWPEGKAGALTTSWDDGTQHDRRLVQILNASGIKGTWNLNAKVFAGSYAENFAKTRVTGGEVRTLYAGHEIACHGFTHPLLDRIPEEAVLAEMMADRRGLEELAGYPVKGMALPCGVYDQRVLRVLRACGILHCRTVKSHAEFGLPEDFIEWHPTCHHKQDLTALWKSFQASGSPDKLFYLWGHSYEFESDHNWEHIEAFAKLAGPDPAVWHATNMEIYSYVTAWRGLWCAMDMTSVKNTAAVPVWFRMEGKLQVCEPGKTLTT